MRWRARSFTLSVDVPADRAKSTATLSADERLGARIRRRRTERKLTLDALAARTGVSKPYLSLIETGRVTNPPSDEKLRQIEQALGFNVGELVRQAHLDRTPGDVRAMLLALARRAGAGAGGVGLDLDKALDDGDLQRLVEQTAGNVDPAPRVNAVPVINKVSCGYPREFTDLDYPARHADAHVSCPDVDDPDAFAARVHGDSMSPPYGEGDIVIFSPNSQAVHGDDCFVRLADGESTFKRVFFEEGAEIDGRRPQVIRLQPRNERYPPRVIAAEQVEAIYRAAYRLERVNGGGPGRP